MNVISAPSGDDFREMVLYKERIIFPIRKIQKSLKLEYTPDPMAACGTRLQIDFFQSS